MLGRYNGSNLCFSSDIIWLWAFWRGCNSVIWPWAFLKWPKNSTAISYSDIFIFKCRDNTLEWSCWMFSNNFRMKRSNDLHFCRPHGLIWLETLPKNSQNKQKKILHWFQRRGLTKANTQYRRSLKAEELLSNRILINKCDSISDASIAKIIIKKFNTRKKSL